MLAYSDARSEAGDLLGSKVVRRGGIGAPAYGGSVIVRALSGSAEVRVLGVIQCGFGTSRRCNGYKRQGAQ